MNDELIGEKGRHCYQFCGFDSNDYSLNNLAGSLLYYNSLTKFNDPFEGRAVVKMPEYSGILDEQYKQVVDRLLAQELMAPDREFAVSQRTGQDSHSLLNRQTDKLFNKALYPKVSQHGICCFSMEIVGKPHPLGNQLMWSHYADGFKGFCIEFDGVALVQALEKHGVWIQIVEYLEARPTINSFEFFRDWQREGVQSPFEKQRIIEKLIASKPKAWEYENELRLIHSKLVETRFPYPVDTIKRVIVSKNAGEKNIKNLKVALRKAGIKHYSEAKLHDETYGILVTDDFEV